MTRPEVLAVWALLTVALVACAAAGAGPTRVASLRRLLHTATATTPRIVGCMLAWAWCGWHFFAR